MCRFLIILLMSILDSRNISAQTFKNSWAIAPVVSFATLPSGIKQRRRELGLGLAFDSHLFGRDLWQNGPGLALMMTMPLDNGNRFVRVSPYSFYVEPRWTWWLVLKKNQFSATPFVGVKSIFGAQIINRQVNNSKSSNMLWLMAFGPRLGMAYWFSHYGLVGSYDLSFGTHKIRQEFGLSLVWHNI